MRIKHNLYNKYGAMLLGYILEVVKTREVAEQYLIDLFAGLKPMHIQQMEQSGTNTFISLQRLARTKLVAFTQSVDDCAEQDGKPQSVMAGSNKFIRMMSPEQQVVFCGVHYHGKSMASLATELNKPEPAIRQILKDSFIIIRNSRDTAIHQ